MPQISIIVPIYNTGNYLQTCIDSILNQDFTDFELLLVDDGSTDKSIEIERNVCECDSRVKCYNSNAGCVSVARNIGISQATGEFVLFVDSDDYLEPNALSVLVNTANKYHNAEFVQGAFSVLHGGGKIRSSRFDELDKHSNKIFHGLEYIDTLGYPITYPWNSLIKREFLIKNNISFRENLVVQEDLIFIIDLCMNGATGVLTNIPTYVYRYGRPGSLTSVNTNLSDAELRKRKRCLKALILSSEHLINIKKSTPLRFRRSRFYEMVNNLISDNLTGCIGGCTLIYPDKDVFRFLIERFPKIPIGGNSRWKRLLARIYNVNPYIAYNLRRIINIKYRH